MQRFNFIEQPPHQNPARNKIKSRYGAVSLQRSKKTNQDSNSRIKMENSTICHPLEVSRNNSATAFHPPSSPAVDIVLVEHNKRLSRQLCEMTSLNKLLIQRLFEREDKFQSMSNAYRDMLVARNHQLEIINKAYGSRMLQDTGISVQQSGTDPLENFAIGRKPQSSPSRRPRDEFLQTLNRVRNRANESISLVDPYEDP